MSQGIFSAARDAFKQGQLPLAIELFEQFCAESAEPGSLIYQQAQMALVRAYLQNGDVDKAQRLNHPLLTSEHPEVQTWAEKQLTYFRRFVDKSQDQALSQNLAAPQVMKDPHLIDKGSLAVEQPRPDQKGDPSSTPEVDQPEQPPVNDRAQPGSRVPLPSHFLHQC